MTVGGRIFAGFAVLFWAVLPGFGLIDLSTMFVEDSFFAEVAALETSWGVLTTFAVALPFGWAVFRPRDVWPVLALLWLTTAALLLGALLGFSFGPVVMAGVLGVMSLGLLWSARRAGTRYQKPVLSVDWPLLVLAVLALPFWATYAWYALDISRATGSEPEYWTMGIDHWPVQGALGLTLAAASLLHALWFAARSLLRTVLSFSAVSLGISWLLGPETGGSVDVTLLAIAAVLWGLLIALRTLGVPSEAGAQSTKRRQNLRSTAV
ncbi:hypothetical protein [Arthrobacter sp. NPDC089319]|uniref:hypothetical protein n=1 Tax=Arthrobacter sp. NPDC089319 TaxID=3155915 RepID=UPI00344425C7